MSPEAKPHSRINLAAWSMLGGLVLMAVTGGLSSLLGGTVLNVAFLLCQTLVISLVIWQACDPFAEAAQWIGRRFHVPGSVRGATLDAIASSMPELFTGIFFVLVAVYAPREAQENLASIGGDGYGPTVATCAGSAIYNMILIPAICTLAISYVRTSRPTIEIADAVILRDGVWFLGCEMLLILFLFQTSMAWWMGVVFLAVYGVYVGVLVRAAHRFRRAMLVVHRANPPGRAVPSPEKIAEVLEAAGIGTNQTLVAEVCERLSSGAAEDDAETEDRGPQSAEILLGLFRVPLGMISCWAIILVATCVAAAACYWLVEVTRATAEQLGAPVFFVAVILAAAASSVPDTFLSLGAARRGDDDGAVSNAFGSNIFDICVCLSIPLLVITGLNGWQPITLTQNGEPMPGLVGIRVLLCVFSIVTLLIMWEGRQLTRRKALVLCGLYGLFVLYAIAGSLGFTFGGLLA